MAHDLLVACHAGTVRQPAEHRDGRIARVTSIQCTVLETRAAAGKFRRGEAGTCGMRGRDGVAPMGMPSNADGSNPRCPKCGAKPHRRETRELVREGTVSREMLDARIGPKGVILRGGGLDEALQASRRLPDVLAAQGDTVKVLHTLTPLVVVMAGAEEFDPYKD